MEQLRVYEIILPEQSIDHMSVYILGGQPHIVKETKKNNHPSQIWDARDPENINAWSWHYAVKKFASINQEMGQTITEPDVAMLIIKAAAKAREYAEEHNYPLPLRIPQNVRTFMKSAADKLDQQTIEGIYKPFFLGTPYIYSETE